MPSNRDFLPRRQAQLLAFTTNFADQLLELYEHVGLSLDDVNIYAQLNVEWTGAYNASQAPSTRTPVVIERKEQKRKAIVASTRRLARQIQAYPGTSDDDRIDLGLTVPDPTPSPVPVPTAGPLIEVLASVGQTLSLRFRDAAEPTNGGKPAGVGSFNVFYFVGETPPNDVNAWTYASNRSRTSFTSAVEERRTRP